MAPPYRGGGKRYPRTARAGIMAMDLCAENLVVYPGGDGVWVDNQAEIGRLV